jgi:hypothetical protein
MTNSNNKRKKLNKEQVAQIITEWNQKSIEDFANEFEVAPNTIRSMVSAIRKVDPAMCPKKPRTKREDLVREAFEMISAEDDVITDK